MNRTELVFHRPETLAASAPPELMGHRRDQVRLLVSDSRGHHHTHFTQLAAFLRPGDLLIANESATLPASLPATGQIGDFLLNLSTHYGQGLWLTEPRWTAAQPGPLPLNTGDHIQVAGVEARVVAPYPGIPRLWFVQMAGDLNPVMHQWGTPIRYGYVSEAYPLKAYQTIFARIPGSAEMPSAARPFTSEVLATLQARGVRLAHLVLHTGVSSLEVEADDIESQPLYSEPFEVPAQTAAEVNLAKHEGRRVIAIGTTVVRALETAWERDQVLARRGFTRLYIHPGRPLNVVDGLLTGLHDPVTSHLALLYTLAGKDRIQEAYREAIRAGYYWHEFGDSHLILPGVKSSRIQ